MMILIEKKWSFGDVSGDFVRGCHDLLGVGDGELLEIYPGFNANLRGFYVKLPANHEEIPWDGYHGYHPTCIRRSFILGFASNSWDLVTTD